MPGVRPGDGARGGFNRQIAPPLDLGLPYWFHLFFPDRLLTTDLKILVVGADDGLAVRLARANPRARLTALETRPVAQEDTARAREHANVGNLDVVSDWPSKHDVGTGFDLVYYNTQSWPDAPAAALDRAADLLRLEGALHLTVRASYAWSGVRTVLELLDRLGIEPDADGYPRAREIVAALGPDHPWNLLGPMPAARPDDLLADWLRPDEPCYSVPEVYALLAGSGLNLQRFTYQAYYLPQCSPLARTPLLGEVRQLPLEQQQALMELYWPGVRYHLAVACRPERPAAGLETDFSGRDWQRYAPLLPARLPIEDDESPVGAKGRLCWRAEGMPEVGVSLGGFQYRLLRAVDRAEQLGDVVGLAGLSGDPQLRDEWARDFFQVMADYDFLHFRTCPVPGGSAAGRATRPPKQAARALPDLEPLAASLEDAPPLPGIGSEWQDVLKPEPPAAEQPPTGPTQLPESGQTSDSKQLPELRLPRESAQPTQPLDVAKDQDNAGAPSAATLALPVSLAEVDSLLVNVSPQSAPAQPTEVARPAPEPATQPAHNEELARYERIAFEACPLCAQAGATPLRQAQGEIQSGGRLITVSLPWVRCRGCGHIFTAGYFAGETWRRILEASLAGRGALSQALAHRAGAARIVATLTTLRESASGRWLDVGCSHSGLIAVAAEFGYEAVGLDCCHPAAERLSKLGYSIRKGSLFDCNDGPFDVISLSGILDRMPFPAQALRHVQGLLARRGLVFVSTPSSDSLGWRNLDLEGNNPYWARLDRYHNFVRKSLFRLLQSVGLEPCSYGAGAPEPVGMEVVACKR
jgi:hypothetical protein